MVAFIHQVFSNQMTQKKHKNCYLEMFVDGNHCHIVDSKVHIPC